jgi:uncharacterized membrane protein YcfT
MVSPLGAPLAASPGVKTMSVAEPTPQQRRVDWVDYAKGWCIILVVMMHAADRILAATGQGSWVDGFIGWARPFRMPDFFLVAGLFLAAVVDRPWRDYLDRKVLHFAYFFTLWTIIQYLPKMLVAGDGPGAVAAGLGELMIQPPGSLWFIEMLPLFFVATKLLRGVNPFVVMLGAAALQIAHVATGWILIDEFAARYVYFFAGYAFAPYFFRLAEKARERPERALPALVAWAFVNGLLVRYGVAPRPGVSLLLGFAGAAAVVSVSALLARRGAIPWLRTLGSKSLVVYLAFFLPMAATRVVLLGAGLVADLGAVVLIVTAVSVAVPPLLERWTRGTKLAFLFERPRWLRLARPAPARAAVAGIEPRIAS